MSSTAIRGEAGPVQIVLALIRRQLYSLAPVLVIVLPVIAIVLFAPSAGMFALMALVLVPTRIGTDLTEYALPASARQIRISRICVALLVRWSPSLLWFAVSAPRSISRLSNLEPTTVVAMMFALAALPEALDRWIQWAPSQMRFMVGALFAFVGTNLLIFVHDAPITTIVLVLVAVCIVGLAIEVLEPARTPSSDLSSAHVEKDAESDLSIEDHSPEANVGEGLGWRDYAKVFFATFNRGQFLIALFMVLLFAILSSQFLLGLAMISSNLIQPVGKLGWLAVFPVRQRAQLAMQVAAPVAVVLLTLVMHFLPIPYVRSFLESGAPQTSDSQGIWWDNPTRLPLTYWIPAPIDASLEIRAPWGESAIADTVTALGTRYVNPFTVNRTNSVRFTDWQRSQMTQAVYGREVSARELRRGTRYPRVTDSWRMLVLQGSILLAWFLFVATVSVAHPVASFYAAGAPMLLMLSEMVRGLDNGEAIIPLLQRWLLSVDSAIPSDIVVIGLATIPVGLMLGALWFVISHGSAFRHLRYAALTAGLAK